MHFIDSDFYLQQQEADRRWGLASSLALCVHAALFLMVMYMPSFFDTKPILEEVVSVSLVSLPETNAPSAPPSAASNASKPVAEKKIEAPPPPPPSEPAAPPEPVAPPPPKAQVPVEPETAPPEPVAATNPVSIFPDKRKIKKAQDVRLEEDKIKEREVQERQQEERELKKKIEERQREVQQRQQEERELQKKIEERKREAERKEAVRRDAEKQKVIAQAKNEQMRAENEAKQASAEARKLEAEARAAREAVANTRSDATRQTQAMQNAVTQTSSGRQNAQSLVEQNYWNAVGQRVKSFWKLTEEHNWEASLLAQVVITINKDGDVVNIKFNQRSKDPLFDQLLEKTIKKATPMPRFPTLLQQETTDVWLQFRPGDLGKM